MALPAWFGRSLPCGCRLGVKLCAEGEALWDAVADAHKALMAVWFDAGNPDVDVETQLRRRHELQAQHAATTDAYEAALATFSAHVEHVAEAATQESLL